MYLTAICFINNLQNESADGKGLKMTRVTSMKQTTAEEKWREVEIMHEK